MNYEVTIGIPVYNVEKYIRRSMESALAQTFPSIEILVCDDCGTDASMDIVREYQQNHPRGKDIRVVRQPRNMGLGQGRNRMIDEARGRYIYFFDADDDIVPETIQVLYENAVKYRAEIVYGSHERIEEFGDGVNVKNFQYPAMQFLEGDDFPNYVYREYEGIQATTWNFLIDVNIYRKNNIRYKAVNFWEDFTTTIDLPTYITRAVLLPDLTYKYYCRFGSLSNFQKRSHIDKAEVQKTMDALNLVKANSDRIRQKPYFPKRSCKVMKTCFFMVCKVLKDRAIIQPGFTNRELRDFMKYPGTLGEVLRFKQWRMKNLTLYLLGVLPPALSVFIIREVGMKRGLIQ